jgi:MFS transporter, SP family, xylose:H+ symportor
MVAQCDAGHYNTGYIWTISCIAALGGLLFGYDWVVVGGAKPFYEAYFQLTSQTLIGWANSCALVGCLIGSTLCGTLADRFGRKKLLLLSGLLFTGSSLCTGRAEHFSSFVLARIAGGIAIGISSNISPTYIAEVSPAVWRGRLVTLNQLAIVSGVLAAQIANWLIAEPVPDRASAQVIRDSWNGQWGWRWMFLAVAVPSLVLSLSALFIPESPRWLAKKGQDTKARQVLVRIGGQSYAISTFTDIRDALAADGHSSHAWRELMSPAVLTVLVIGISLAVLQQWSGINVIFSYAEEIYRNAGYGLNGVLFNIVITGSVSLSFTLIALGLVDHFGRRPLILLGAAGIAASHIVLGVAYALGVKGLPILVLTLCTIGFYSLSLAPITWVLISEIYPNRIRGLAVSISVSALWVACFAVNFTFPLLNQALGPAGTFWLYGAICLAGFLFIWVRVPETKGMTLEEIERGIVLH